MRRFSTSDWGKRTYANIPRPSPLPQFDHAMLQTEKQQGQNVLAAFIQNVKTQKNSAKRWRTRPSAGCPAADTKRLSFVASKVMTRIVRGCSSLLERANKTTSEEPDSLRQTQTRGQKPGAASTQKPKSLNLHNDVSFAGGARHTTTQTQTQTPDNARRRTTKRSRLRPRARLACLPARPPRPRPLTSPHVGRRNPPIAGGRGHRTR